MFTTLPSKKFLKEKSLTFPCPLSVQAVKTEMCPDGSSFIAFQLYGCGQILDAIDGGGMKH